MASSKLIGTAPDQVPTNADLGELAFQNKDSVEFTGGKGGLSSLDLTAIAASKNVSAVDIFILSELELVQRTAEYCNSWLAS